MVSNQRDAYDTDAGSGECPYCLDADPTVRYGHLLTLARTQSLEAIERHSWDNLRRTKLATEDIRRYVAARLEWVRDQVTSYSGLVDAQTGAQLPWWEGRRQTILAFRAATERQAREAAEAREARERQARGRWGIPPAAPGTPLPEPTAQETQTWDDAMAMAGVSMREPGDEEEVYTDELAD